MAILSNLPCVTKARALMWAPVTGNTGGMTNEQLSTAFPANFVEDTSSAGVQSDAAIARSGSAILLGARLLIGSKVEFTGQVPGMMVGLSGGAGGVYTVTGDSVGIYYNEIS